MKIQNLHRLPKAFALALSCFIFLGLAHDSHAQSAESPSQDEVQNVKKVKIVRNINGETVIEERVITDDDVQVFVTDEAEVEIRGGGDGQKVIVTKEGKDGEEVEVNVQILGDGDHAKVRTFNYDFDVSGEEGDAQTLILHAKELQERLGKDGKVGTHVIKIVNGDTVINETSGDMPSDFLWIDEDGNHTNLDGNTFIFKGDCDGEAHTIEKDVKVEVLIDEDGTAKTKTAHVIMIMQLEDLTEEESAKFAPEPYENLDVQQLKFYPNPTNGQFQLSFDINDTESPTQIRIFDLEGKEAYTETVTGTPRYDKQIDLGDAPKGVYLISIAQNDKKVVKKLIMQ